MTTLINVLSSASDLPKELIVIVFAYIQTQVYRKHDFFKHSNNRKITSGLIRVNNENIFIFDLASRCTHIYNLDDYKHTQSLWNGMNKIIDMDISCDRRWYLCYNYYLFTYFEVEEAPTFSSVTISRRRISNFDHMFVKSGEIIFIKENPQKIGMFSFITMSFIPMDNAVIKEEEIHHIVDDINVKIDSYFYKDNDELIYIGRKVWCIEKDRQYSSAYVTKNEKYYLYVLHDNGVEIYEQSDFKLSFKKLNYDNIYNGVKFSSRTHITKRPH